MSMQIRSARSWPVLALVTAAALPLITGAVVWGDPGSRNKHPVWKDPPLRGLAAKRQRVLDKIPGDPSVLVNVRYEHLPATGDMTLLGKAALPALERGLTHNVKPAVRQRIAWVLTDLADHHSRHVLRAALKDWNSTVRRQAIQGLAAMGDLGAERLLWQRYDDPEENDDVQTAALKALGRIGAIKSAPRLLRILADKKDKLSSTTRAAALQGLWDLRLRLGVKPLRRILTLALASDDAYLNTFAAAGAAELRDPSSAVRRALVKRLRHPNANVRNLAVYALGEIGHKGSIGALRKRLGSARSARLLNNIAFALRKMGDTRIMALLGGLLSHRLAIIRLNAAYVLGDIGDPAAIPLLAKALKDPSDFVRASAINALGRMGSRKAEVHLKPLLTSGQLALRMEAIFALNRITAGKYNNLIARELLFHKRQTVRRAAALELANRDDTRAIGPLLFCHAKRRCSNRTLARSLGSIRSWRATPPLLVAYSRQLSPYSSGAKSLLRAVGKRKLKPGHREVLRSLLTVGKWNRSGRRPLLRLLGRLQDRSARGAYWGFLRSRDRLTRLNAAFALANQGYERGRKLLLNALTQAAPRVKRGAADLLRSITHKKTRATVHAQLKKALTGHGPDTRLAAAYALTGWNAQAGVKILMGALAHTSRRVRHEAAYYLMRPEMRGHRSLVAKILASEKRPAMRGTLRRILRQMTPGTLKKVSGWVTL
jgi:HEAT repeat protein